LQSLSFVPCQKETHRETELKQSNSGEKHYAQHLQLFFFCFFLPMVIQAMLSSLIHFSGWKDSIPQPTQ